MRARAPCAGLLATTLATFVAASVARAQSTVEKEHGPATTVRPSFGGGHSVETEGQSKTEVKPKFGGGYTLEKQDAGAKTR